MRKNLLTRNFHCDARDTYIGDEKCAAHIFGKQVKPTELHRVKHSSISDFYR